MARKHESTLAMDYVSLRKATGWVGLSFPFVLMIGGWIFQAIGHQPLHVESQISQYYYTGMRDVFVGMLCALGVFHLASEGYGPSDRVAGRLACVFGVGIAWFPVTRHGMPRTLVGEVHYILAGLLFGTLAYFCIFLFTRTGDKRKRTNRKKVRNVVYYVCGGIIVAFTVVIASLTFFEGHTVPTEFTEWLRSSTWQFWLETLALVAFGVAFLVKGELILTDVVQPAKAKRASQE
jgi:succinate dehydrogenase hydrophobic anchor subunit